MIIECLNVGVFQENTWILGERPGGEAVVIDPGGENEWLLARIEAHELKVRAIVNTHGHIDHIYGAAELRRTLAVPFRMHAADRFLLAQARASCAMFGLEPVEAPVLDEPITDGEEIRVGELAIRVIHTPGHSPGGCSLLAGAHLFAGDTLFAGSIGRTDLPGGDMETLMDSIFTRLIEPLPGATILHSGHGPDSSLAEEAASNPFLLDWRA